MNLVDSDPDRAFKPVDAGALRVDVMRRCAAGDYVDAILLLEESGLSAEDAPGLWEYLARQLTNAGLDQLAITVRERLAVAGTYTSEMALSDAKLALEQGNSERARIILKSVFGHSDMPDSVAKLLARAIGDSDPQTALGLIAELSENDPEAALAEIDILRANERLIEAEKRCRSKMRRFLEDDRFHTRLARISTSLNNLDDALAIWTAVGRRSPSMRATTLLNRIRLLHRLERYAEAKTLIADMLADHAPLADLMSAVSIFGMTDLSDALLMKAVNEHRFDPLSDREWNRVQHLLLQNGEIGRLVWLSKQKVPIGKTVQEALAAAKRLFGPRLDQIKTISDGAAFTSPDCLLPFPPHMHFARPLRSLDDERCKILLVNASLAGGGAERQLVVLVKALIHSGISAENIDVALFSLSQDRGRAHFLKDMETLGVRIHDLQQETEQRHITDKDFEDRVLLLPSPLRGDVVALQSLVQKLKPDVLHGWQDRASLAVGFVGAHLGIESIVMSARNMQPQKREPGAQQDFQGLFRALCALPNVTLTANAVEGARDYEAWLEMDRGSVRVLENGLDLSRFRMPRAKAKSVTDGKRTVTISGVFRLAPNKRPLLWLDTIARLTEISQFDIQARLIGVGPLRAEVEDHCETLGLYNVQLEGSHNEIGAIYKGSDIVLLMSRVEGTPNVLLEAQALGLPVVGCDVGGVRSAIQSEGPSSGLVLPEIISATDAADAIEAWLPEALAAPAKDRRNFIRDRYSLSALGRNALLSYRQEATF
jgi:glycosyltransferase involved in cell wall biosynthesis/thioredoxin-like negative regulator of GroEL